MANEFAARTSVEQVEEGAELAPKFDAEGLIPAVTTDAATGEVLMVGYMNAEALRKTIETGEAHYWSRSRQVLWHKGATSGLVQKVAELMIDDDQDCVWLKVRVAGDGASCHVGYRTCFYRRSRSARAPEALEFTRREGVRPEGRLRRRTEPDQALASPLENRDETAPSPAGVYPFLPWDALSHYVSQFAVTLRGVEKGLRHFIEMPSISHGAARTMRASQEKVRP